MLELTRWKVGCLSRSVSLSQKMKRAASGRVWQLLKESMLHHQAARESEREERERESERGPGHKSRGCRGGRGRGRGRGPTTTSAPIPIAAATAESATVVSESRPRRARGGRRERERRERREAKAETPVSAPTPACIRSDHEAARKTLERIRRPAAAASTNAAPPAAAEVEEGEVTPTMEAIEAREAARVGAVAYIRLPRVFSHQTEGFITARFRELRLARLCVVDIVQCEGHQEAILSVGEWLDTPESRLLQEQLREGKPDIRVEHSRRDFWYAKAYTRLAPGQVPTGLGGVPLVLRVTDRTSREGCMAAFAQLEARHMALMERFGLMNMDNLRLRDLLDQAGVDAGPPISTAQLPTAADAAVEVAARASAGFSHPTRVTLAPEKDDDGDSEGEEEEMRVVLSEDGNSSVWLMPRW